VSANSPPSGQRLRIGDEHAAAAAARSAQELAVEQGLAATEAVQVATAVSELAMNLVLHAGGGELELCGDPRGVGAVTVIALDRGPGIAEPELVMQDGYSTGGGLGLGLPGARRLMDELHIAPRVGGGTIVTMRKRSRPRHAPRITASLDIATAGSQSRARTVADAFRGGALLATVARESEAEDAQLDELVELLGEQRASSPVALAHRCRAIARRAGSIGLAIASFSALDGQLVWLTAGRAEALLLRPRLRELKVVGRAPAHRGLDPGPAALRAATVAVLRDDVLLLASAPRHRSAAALPSGSTIAHVAEQAAGERDGAVVAARCLRGAFDQP
jgi:serine/threonine-protein kinase RsbT